MRNALLALSCCIKAAAAMSPREALAKRVVASPAPVLAPLTRAGTAPFRALCRRHGADATMGEMIFARQLCKGDRREQARLRRPEAETLFGAQIATNQISEGVAACVLAEEAGAAWVDLNCGCPIYEATRRGLGSALLRKPAKLARLVGGLVEGSPLPVSVKIRLSPAGNKDVNALEHIEALAALDHKPAFVTLHARTATQRYGRAATWEDVEACARKAGDAFPVLGNGDVLTHFEARRKRAVAPTAAGLMVGRGALINPWLFDDIRNEKSWLPTAEERLEVYYSLVAGYRDTFGAVCINKIVAFDSLVDFRTGSATTSEEKRRRGTLCPSTSTSSTGGGR